MSLSDHMLSANYASGWPASGGPGGGDPPAWARSGSIADIDFVNDPPRAWTSTGGEIAFEDFGTILGSSVLFPTFTYDPLLVDLGVGYGTGDPQGFGTFIGDMAEAFNFGFTMIAEFNEIFGIELTEGTFTTDIAVELGAGQEPGIVDQYDVNFVYADARNVAAGAHKFGMTLTQDTFYVAVDNESLVDNPGPATVVDPEAPLQPTDMVFHSAKLKRLTIYNPIKTEAEQRTLTA